MQFETYFHLIILKENNSRKSAKRWSDNSFLVEVYYLFGCQQNALHVGGWAKFPEKHETNFVITTALPVGLIYAHLFSQAHTFMSGSDHETSCVSPGKLCPPIHMRNIRLTTKTISDIVAIFPKSHHHHHLRLHLYHANRTNSKTIKIPILEIHCFLLFWDAAF